jgi:oxalate decarboxylase/phosphoglucose isomerase-like protein (cupin superfamily)
METATNTQNNEAKVIRSNEHQVVADQFCGKLTVLPNGTVIANGFVNNIGHSHSLFDETYLVLEGDLRMALHNPETGIITEVSLKKLDAVRIPRGTGHKVIGGSNDNCIMVSCEPHFISGDEVSCPQLEQRYASTPTNMPAKLNLSDSRLFPER